MQKNSDTKAGAIIAAGVIVIFLSLLIGFFVMLMAIAGDIFVGSFLLFYIIFEAAIIVGVLIALKQRLNELNNKELDESKKY